MHFHPRSQTNSEKHCVLEKSCVEHSVRDGKTSFIVPCSLLPLCSRNYWAEETEAQTVLPVKVFGMVTEFAVQRDRGSKMVHGCREPFNKENFPDMDNPNSDIDDESRNQKSNTVSGIYAFVCWHYNFGRGKSCVTKCLFRYLCLTLIPRALLWC